MTPNPYLKAKIEQYLSVTGQSVKLKGFLGGGTDGDVWATYSDTAIKAFLREPAYLNERDSYHRLAEFGVTEKLGIFWIPKMISSSDELLVIEMDFMQHPPYIIDFGKVKINSPPDFDELVLVDDDAKNQERFGKNWPKVQALLKDLESFLIYYLDPSPSNIVFSPDTESPP
jgi:hypothetical protein